MFIKIGNWFFHYRNIIFPVFYAALFIPSSRIFSSAEIALVSGLLLIGIGILVRTTTIGLVYIIRGGVKRMIHADTLVTDGIYKICRNPMYLGNILLIIGFGILANSLLFCLIFTPLFIIIYFFIIRAEEDYLARKFGSLYVEYKSQTNVIIPRLKNIKSAFEGKRFNWKKVLNKEHNSLFIYFSGICILLLYHNYSGIGIFIIAQTILTIFYITIKTLKIRNII